MLVNSRDLLIYARAQKKRIPAFNVYNLESMQAVFAASKAAQQPVIIAFGESYLWHTGFAVIAAMANALAQEHPFPVVLHLDHSKNPDNIRRAIQNGFTSVMFDGSRLPLQQNIAQTLLVVNMAHDAGVTVEGELGGMNPEDGESMDDNDLIFTSPVQAKEYVQATSIDSLAVSIGNAHGLYKGVPKLDMVRLGQIANAVPIPLVLHGCSGIPADQLKQATSLGVCKINVNTELALAAGRAVKDMTAQEQPIRFEKIAGAAQAAMEKAILPFLQYS